MNFFKISSQINFSNIQIIQDRNTRSKIGIALLRRFLRTGLFYILKRSWRRGAARFFFGSIRVFFWSLRQHYNTSSCLIWWFAHLREKWSPCWKQMWRRYTFKVYMILAKFGCIFVFFLLYSNFLHISLHLFCFLLTPFNSIYLIMPFSLIFFSLSSVKDHLEKYFNCHISLSICLFITAVRP